MEFVVKIEQKHIDNGTPNTTRSCPLALAFKDTIRDNQEISSKVRMQLDGVLNDTTSCEYQIDEGNVNSSGNIVFVHSPGVEQFTHQFDKEPIKPGPVNVLFYISDKFAEQYEYGTATLVTSAHDKEVELQKGQSPNPPAATKNQIKEERGTDMTDHHTAIAGPSQNEIWLRDWTATLDRSIPADTLLRRHHRQNIEYAGYPEPGTKNTFLSHTAALLLDRQIRLLNQYPQSNENEAEFQACVKSARIFMVFIAESLKQGGSDVIEEMEKLWQEEHRQARRELDFIHDKELDDLRDEGKNPDQEFFRRTVISAPPTSKREASPGEALRQIYEEAKQAILDGLGCGNRTIRFMCDNAATAQTACVLSRIIKSYEASMGGAPDGFYLYCISAEM